MTAPLYLFDVPLERLSLLHLLPLAQLGKLAFEHKHRLLAVLNLTALRLTGNHDARGNVRDSDCAFRFVDVLTSRAAAAVGVHLQILVLYDYVGIVVDDGHNLQGGKACVSAFVCVKGRNAHQAVHPLFGFEIPVSIVAENIERNAFYACLVSVQPVGDFRL